MKQRIMNWIQKSSMRNMMLMSACLALIPISIIYSISFHYVNQSALHLHMTESWQRQADQIAKMTTFAVMTRSSEQAQATVAIFQINEQILFLNIFSNDQNIYTFGSPLSCGQSQKNPENIHDFFETRHYWCFQAPVTDSETQKTIGGIQLTVSKVLFNQMVYQNLLINLLMIFLLFFVILFLIFYLTKFLTRPLTTAVNVMTKTQEGSRGLRIDTHGPQEISSIQDSFNQMINSLELHETRLESLVAERTIELSNAYQSAQAASQVKSDILHIISHEMKTPLHNIKLPLEVFMADHKGIDDSQITIALKSVSKLNDLIQDLLIYAKGASKAITPSKTEFGLGFLVKEVVDQINPIAKNKGNTILIKKNHDVLLYSDEKMLRQVLLNLLSNANKFTLNGTIEISYQQQKEQMMISVSDTGCGIDKDNINSIFQPFYQVDMSPTRSYSGTGLGLAICKLFTETLNGHISVESQPKRGSTFFLQIPMIVT